MFPFKKYEPSSAKRGKRCNLIKIQRSFNPGGRNGRAMRRSGYIHTRYNPKGFKYIFLFWLPIPAACVGFPPRTMQAKNDDSKSYRCGYDHERRKRVVFDSNIASVLVRETCPNVIKSSPIYLEPHKGVILPNNSPVTMLAVYISTDHGYDHM